MSSIEKMSVQGIRSYSHLEPSVIEFQKPLTLIVGHNGAGKTTVIESLRYMATGDMPPGTKNSSFVHDPKVAGEHEVKGQVKLKFKDVTGHNIVVTRTLASSQKGRTVSTKSMDGSIMREVQGERQSISSKCAEMNREMISFLGVSRAVLDNVIFCHQEDSNWPLSEGKVLKQKFDDIFAATRYIKALESIRKLRLEQASTIKEYTTELKYLKGQKDKSAEIAHELSQKQGKIEATRQNIEQLNEDLEPVEIRLAELVSIADDVHKLEKEHESLITERKQLLKIEDDLKEKITNLFDGPEEELRKIYDDFQSKVLEKEEKLMQGENEIAQFTRDQQRFNSQQSKMLLEHGKLEQQARRHQQNIVDRDLMISKQADMYGIEGYERGPFSQAQTESFMNDMKRKYQKVIDETKQQRSVLSSSASSSNGWRKKVDSEQSFQEKIENVQKQLDEVKRSQTQYEETVRRNKRTMSENVQKLKEIGRELSNIDASANRLERVEVELKSAEQELRETKSVCDINKLNEEVDQLQAEKRKVDNELSRLRDEQQTMHRQSSTQARLDMFLKEKSSVEDEIQKLTDRHEENLKQMFQGIRGTTEGLLDKLNKHLKEKRQEAQSEGHKLQQLNQELARRQTKKKMLVGQLSDQENEAKQYKQQIKRACGDNEYNAVKQEVQEGIKYLNEESGNLQSVDKIYKMYIRKLEHKNVKNTGCPLCHRVFEHNKEIAALIDELKTKLVELPAKTRENADKLKAEQEKYDTILSLGPLKEKLEQLETAVLPQARAELREKETELEELVDQVQEQENVKALADEEELNAREIEPDVRLLDSEQKDLKNLDRQISLQQSKLQGVAPGRTMQLVTNEITDRQDRADTLNRHIDRKRNQITQHQRHVASLETAVHDLKTDKLQLQAQLQHRTNLEEQKADLSSSNLTFSREIKEAEEQLRPIQAKLDELLSEKRDIQSSKESADDENRRKLSEIKASGEKVMEKTEEIKRYIHRGGDTELEENERTLRQFDQKLKQLEAKKKTAQTQLDSLKTDITKQQVRTRELEDNLQLKRIQEDVKDNQRKLASVKNNLQEFGEHGDINRERTKLQQQSDELRKQRAMYEGRQRGYEDEVRRFQQELRSDMYKNAEDKYRQKVIAVKTTEMANSDLDKYYKALDRAIMKYHSLKMEEINKIVKEYWINTYRGHDIDTIEIRSEDEEGSGAAKQRRSYNYKVVMVKGDTALDMRGRCSAGQKVLASLIIRLALAETFCLNCGILTLDEPTCNLDEENIESLANHLTDVIRTRQSQKNYQLVVITHDEEFVELLGRSDFVDYYFKIFKDENGYSKIAKQSVAALREPSQSQD